VLQAALHTNLPRDNGTVAGEKPERLHLAQADLAAVASRRGDRVGLVFPVLALN